MAINDYPYTYETSLGTELRFKSPKALTNRVLRQLLKAENAAESNFMLVDLMIHPDDMDAFDDLPTSETDELLKAWQASEADADLPKSSTRTK